MRVELNARASWGHGTCICIMGRWLCLLLLEALIITLIISSVNATEERCIQLKFSDANSLSFRGLLLQKYEQVNVDNGRVFETDSSARLE